jgi:membrane-associated protein
LKQVGGQPFLPGDSLLFAAGALAKLTGALDIKLLYLLMVLAAILGDTANYWIGHILSDQKYLNRKAAIQEGILERTHAFYEKHGGKDHLFGAFHPHHPYFCSFRGRHRTHVLWAFSLL